MVVIKLTRSALLRTFIMSFFTRVTTLDCHPLLWLIYIAGDGFRWRPNFGFQTGQLYCTMQKMFTLHKLRFGFWSKVRSPIATLHVPIFGMDICTLIGNPCPAIQISHYSQEWWHIPVIPMIFIILCEGHLLFTTNKRKTRWS